MLTKLPSDPDAMSRAAPIRFLRLRDVMSRTGLGQDSIYRLGREGKFPKPIKITERATGWLEHEINAYLASRVAARDAAAATS